MYNWASTLAAFNFCKIVNKGIKKFLKVHFKSYIYHWLQYSSLCRFAWLKANERCWNNFLECDIESTCNTLYTQWTFLWKPHSIRNTFFMNTSNNKHHPLIRDHLCLHEHDEPKEHLRRSDYLPLRWWHWLCMPYKQPPFVTNPLLQAAMS